MLELGDVVVIQDPLDQRSHLVRRIIAIGPEKIEPIQMELYT